MALEKSPESHCAILCGMGRPHENPQELVMSSHELPIPFSISGLVCSFNNHSIFYRLSCSPHNPKC